MVRDALAEIASLEAPSKDHCKLEEAVDLLEEDLRPGVRQAILQSSGLTSAAIARWFAAQGIDISERTISRHRKADCVCFG